ncbi:hypothetical protein ACH42_09290 [Endozoicomonas sp. (ex Bugula neritina AB1)]|nr:hypothetical protein ACH42_09290 [Endozoicomonas sp. (ex Bugula neritina AB1)]
MSGHGDNDILNGQSGNDIMEGSQGNDTYVVDSASDQVIEQTDEGIDTVKSSVVFTLSDNLENLELTGEAELVGIGNELDNEITENSKNRDLPPVGFTKYGLIDVTLTTVYNDAVPDEQLGLRYLANVELEKD